MGSAGSQSTHGSLHPAPAQGSYPGEGPQSVGSRSHQPLAQAVAGQVSTPSGHVKQGGGAGQSVAAAHSQPAAANASQAPRTSHVPESPVGHLKSPADGQSQESPQALPPHGSTLPPLPAPPPPPPPTPVGPLLGGGVPASHDASSTAITGHQRKSICDDGTPAIGGADRTKTQRPRFNEPSPEKASTSERTDLGSLRRGEADSVRFAVLIERVAWPCSAFLACFRQSPSSIGGRLCRERTDRGVLRRSDLGSVHPGPRRAAALGPSGTIARPVVSERLARDVGAARP